MDLFAYTTVWTIREQNQTVIRTLSHTCQVTNREEAIGVALEKSREELARTGYQNAELNHYLIVAIPRTLIAEMYHIQNPIDSL